MNRGAGLNRAGRRRMAIVSYQGLIRSCYDLILHTILYHNHILMVIQIVIVVL